jgi:hypothetical protein
MFDFATCKRPRPDWRFDVRQKASASYAVTANDGGASRAINSGTPITGSKAVSVTPFSNSFRSFFP